MANEATVQAGLRVKAGNIDYQSRPVSYNADVTGRKGPSPGAFSVSISGTDCDLSQFSQVGLCWIQNLDETNWVSYGVFEPATETYYPVGELLPGECIVLRLSRSINEEFVGTVTGTSSVSPNNSFRFKADTSSCNVRVDAFEV